MTIPNKYQAPTNTASEIPLPLCPHCDEELPVVSCFSWQQGIFLVMCVYCPTCRHELHMQVIPNMAAMQEETGRVLVPH